MRPSLFISDLHLHQTRPEISAAFFHFLSNEAAQAGALYILGDLFEFWVGDDQLDRDRFSRKVCDAIRILSDRGVNVFFTHGNRDFLIGERFATEAKLTILTDPTQIRLGENSLLLLHGDTLCTDDLAYQQFRRQTRDIMDVSLATVEQVFRTHGYIDMIHGHTHRPATHVHTVDGHQCTRLVLSDWQTQAEFVNIDDLSRRQSRT